MRKLILAAGAVASLGAMSVADVASAHPHHHHAYYYHHHRYRGGCGYQKHRSGAIGAVSGAVGGGIIGGALTHGGVGGVLLGAGAGALTGHALARSTVHC